MCANEIRFGIPNPFVPAEVREEEYKRQYWSIRRKQLDILLYDLGVK